MRFKPGLVPYITLGDPSIAQTERLVLGAIEAGASMVEIGIPFSDPIADGPVIQASHFRALSESPPPSMKDGLAMVARLRNLTQAPLIFMSSVNLVMAYGVTDFFKDAESVGLSGIVLPDLSFEDGAQYRELGQRHQVDVVLLVSPLCRAERLPAIVNAGQGFLYVIATTGTTGARGTMSDTLPAFVSRIKTIRPDIPVAIGFGISTPDHVKTVISYADAAIVGSYFVNAIEIHGGDYFLTEVERFSKSISVG